jgi:hypothetical protein
MICLGGVRFSPLKNRLANNRKRTLEAKQSLVPRGLLPNIARQSFAIEHKLLLAKVNGTMFVFFRTPKETEQMHEIEKNPDDWHKRGLI